jgi:hypothetical protein
MAACLPLSPVLDAMGEERVFVFFKYKYTTTEKTLRWTSSGDFLATTSAGWPRLQTPSFFLSPNGIKTYRPKPENTIQSCSPTRP